MKKQKSKFILKFTFWNGDSSEMIILTYTRLQALKLFCNVIDDVKMANIKAIEFVR